MFEILKQNNHLTSITTLTNDKITIQPYSNLVIEITLATYFNVYINKKFYYSIESEEILDTFKEFINEEYYFVESKSKNNIKIITRKKFNNKKLDSSKYSIYSFSKKIQ